MAGAPVNSGTGPNFGVVATPRHATHACRWGDSTLNMAFPEWLSAWDTPWTCRHPGHPGPLETVDTCATCPDWRPRERPDALRDA